MTTPLPTSNQASIPRGSPCGPHGARETESTNEEFQGGPFVCVGKVWVTGRSFALWGRVGTNSSDRRQEPVLLMRENVRIRWVIGQQAIRSKAAYWVEILAHEAVLRDSEIMVVRDSSPLGAAGSRNRRRARLSRERTVPTVTTSAAAISS